MTSQTTDTNAMMSGSVSDNDQDEFLDDDEFVDDEGDGRDEEGFDDDDDIFLSENSYTSDVDDDNPLGIVCDMPDEEAAAYTKRKTSQ